jgi:hypothetical protein
MFLIKLMISYLLIFNILTEIPKDKTLFISPVRIPLSLSANFGELRPDHFHSGIDIKTLGVTGKEVVATASGYIYRISISPGGFGKALYLRHPSGYSTVYGHLDRFIPEVEEYIVNQQYEKKNYTITVFPPKDKFQFKQGELIAYSGNTGSSSGPHLHYEIRKSASETPVNPLLFDFGTGDDIVPVIEKLMVYPSTKNTLINNRNNIERFTVSGGHGNYFLPSGSELRISGPAGFGIKAYDLLNDSYNKCAVYEIEMKIDSLSLFRYVMDEFSFSETRYINSHIDYGTYIKERTRYQKTFILPNDKLSVYQDVVNRGIFNFNENKTYHVEIILSDIHNNRSTLSFKVTGMPQESHKAAVYSENSQYNMPYSRSNSFNNQDISLTIPSGSLYDTLYFKYNKSPGPVDMYSDIHHIHDIFTPLHRAYTLSIKPSVIPEGKESKLLIIQLSDDFKKSALGSTYNNGVVTAKPSSFGMFCVGIDTVPPVISANGLTPGIDLSGKKEIRIRIHDDLSGINTYEPIIDGNWALFEYDQKNNVIIYRFDPERITKGTKHNLTLKVSDNVGNESIYKCDFKW